MMNTQMKSKDTAIQTQRYKKERGGGLLLVFFFFHAEIKDEDSRPTAANVRLGAHTYRA